jgi:hypothetical protein
MTRSREFKVRAEQYRLFASEAATKEVQEALERRALWHDRMASLSRSIEEGR